MSGRLYLLCLKLSAWASITSRVKISSQRKRGHHKPLLTCQTIFISPSKCTAIQHSMSFTIHIAKRETKKKTPITTHFEKVKHEGAEQFKLKRELCVIRIGQQYNYNNKNKVMDKFNILLQRVCKSYSEFKKERERERRPSRNSTEAVNSQLHLFAVNSNFCFSLNLF